MSDLVSSALLTQRLRISFDVDLQLQNVPIPGLPHDPAELFPEFVEEFVAMQALDCLNEHVAKTFSRDEKFMGMSTNIIRVLREIARGMAFVDANLPTLSLPGADAQSVPTLPVCISSQVSLCPGITNLTTGYMFHAGKVPSAGYADPDDLYSILENEAGIKTLVFNIGVVDGDESELDLIDFIAGELEDQQMGIDTLLVFVGSNHLRVPNKVCKKVIRRCELAFPERPVLLWTLYNTDHPYLPA